MKPPSEGRGVLPPRIPATLGACRNNKMQLQAATQLNAAATQLHATATHLYAAATQLHAIAT